MKVLAINGSARKDGNTAIIDVEIYEGDFTIIMGSSGAGKSTQLYALSGMDTITAGSSWYRYAVGKT